MRSARSVTAAAPVDRGRVVAADIAGSGIDLAATRTVAKKKARRVRRTFTINRMPLVETPTESA